MYFLFFFFSLSFFLSLFLFLASLNPIFLEQRLALKLCTPNDLKITIKDGHHDDDDQFDIGSAAIALNMAGETKGEPSFSEAGRTKERTAQPPPGATECIVDHVTDGGRWILIASMSSDATLGTDTFTLPPRTLGHTAVNKLEYCNILAGQSGQETEFGGNCINVEELGSIMNVDFANLAAIYDQDSVLDEVRVFGCSLLSQRIVHFKTDHPETLDRVLEDVNGLCRDVVGLNVTTSRRERARCDSILSPIEGE